MLLAACVLSLVTARLGWWQLDRANQKTSLQRSIDTRQALPALEGLELASGGSALEAQMHRQVLMRGRWRPEATVALDNRQMNGRPGFFIITPLVLGDGRAVLVQRGWLPRNFQDRTRVEPPLLPAGEVVVQGRVNPSPARLYEFEAAASGALGRVRQNLDLPAFARETGLAVLPLSVLQQARVGDAPDGLLRDWPAPAVGVAKHHGYAFQWFALCALTVGLYLWFQVFAPRRRRSPDDERQT